MHGRKLPHRLAWRWHAAAQLPPLPVFGVMEPFMNRAPLKMQLQLQSKAMAAAARGQGCSAQGGECNTHRPVPFSRSSSQALVNLSAPSKACSATKCGALL